MFYLSLRLAKRFQFGRPNPVYNYTPIVRHQFPSSLWQLGLRHEYSSSIQARSVSTHYSIETCQSAAVSNLSENEPFHHARLVLKFDLSNLKLPWGYQRKSPTRIVQPVERSKRNLPLGSYWMTDLVFDNNPSGDCYSIRMSIVRDFSLSKFERTEKIFVLFFVPIE